MMKILRFLIFFSNVSKRKTFSTKLSRKFSYKTSEPKREIKKSISKVLKSDLRKRKIGKWNNFVITKEAKLKISFDFIKY